MVKSKLFCLPNIFILVSFILFGIGLVSSATWNNSLDNQLVAYFNFENTSASQTILYENVYGVLNGNFINLPSTSWDVGKIGEGVRFTGVVGEYINLSKLSDYTGYTNISKFTFNFWTNSSAGYPTWNRDLGTQNYYTLWTEWSGGNTMYVEVAGCGNSYNVNAPMTSNQWNMITEIFDKDLSKVIVYFNGVNVGNMTIDPTCDYQALETSIWVGSGLVSNGLVGLIDEMGIWNKSLSDYDVQQLYDSGNGMTYVSNVNSITLVSPANNTVITVPTINFTYTLNSTGGIYNTTLYILNETFAKKKIYNITENSGENQFGYSIRLNVPFDSGMGRNFTGIRFYDGVNKLPYWIQSFNNTDAVIWIKVNLTASSTKSITMYYGNPSMLSESNPHEVFVYYDDFSQNSVNNYSWAYCGGSPSYNVDTVEKVLNISTDGDCYLNISYLQMTDIMSIVNMTIYGDNDVGQQDFAGVVLRSESTSGYITQMFENTTLKLQESGVGDINTTTFYYTQGLYSVLTSKASGNYLESSACNSSGSCSIVITGYDSTTTIGSLSINPFRVKVKVKEIIVMNYTYPEPTVTTESPVILAFNITTIDLNQTVNDTTITTPVSNFVTGVYSWFVEFFDELFQSQVNTFNVSVETNPPVVNITYPLNNTLYYANVTTMDFSISNVSGTIGLYNSSLINGLMVYYDFKTTDGLIQNLSLLANEGSGGIIQNTNCKIGYCGNLSNGNNWKIYANITLNLNITELSWSFWAYPTTTNEVLLMDARTGSGGWGYWSSYQPTDNTTLMNLNGANNIFTPNGTETPPNKWTHTVITRNSSGQWNIYRDGTLIYWKTETVILDWDSTGGLTYLHLGNDVSNNRDYSGLVDEMGFWNRTLSASEVSQIYSNGNGISYSESLSDLNSCWYSLDLGVTNFTVNNCSGTVTNTITGISSSEGNNTWYVWANDTFNNVGFNYVTFEQKTTVYQHTVTLNSPNYYITNNKNVIFNCSTNDTSVPTPLIYNLTLILDGTNNYTVFNSTPNQQYLELVTNLSLSDGNHTWSCFSASGEGLTFSSGNSSIFVDTIFPKVDFIPFTEPDGVNVSQNYIVINISVIELNEANVTYSMNGTVSNTVTFGAGTHSYTFLTVPNGHFNYNATVCDIANNCNTTEGRDIRIITLDTVPPSFSSGGTTFRRPLNNTYFNTSTVVVNFTMNDTTSGVKNVTITVKNQSDVIVGNTTITNLNPYGNIFYSIISYPFTLIDGVYKWFVTAIDFASNVFTSDEDVFTVDTTNPFTNITYPLSTTYTDSFYISPKTTSVTWTITEPSPDTCLLSNGTNNITVTCGSLSYPNLDVGYGSKTISLWMNDSAGNSYTATRNPIFNYGIKNNSVTYNYNAFEGSVQDYVLNFTLGSGQILSSAYLVYDGVPYISVPTSVGGDTIITNTLTLPSINSTTLNTFYWEINLVSMSMNVSSYQQNVTNIGIDNCSVNTYEILRWDLKDEDSLSGYNFSNTTTRINIDLYVSPYGSTTVSPFINYSATEYNPNPLRVCLNVNTSSTRYRIDIVGQYVETLSFNEFFYLDNGTLDNTQYFDERTPHNISLYDLLLTNGQQFIFFFRGNDALRKPDYIVHVLRYYIGEGVYREVERTKLDTNSEGFVHLVEEDELYRFVITYQGKLYYTSPDIPAICQSDPCKLTIIAGFPDVDYGEFYSSSSKYNLSANSDTRTVMVSYTGNTTDTVNLTVKRFTYGEEEIINTTSLTAQAGVLVIQVPQQYGNETFRAYVHVNGMLIKSAIIDFGFDARDYFGATGLILGGILILLIVIMGVTEGGVVTIVLLFMSLIILGIMGLLEMGWYIVIGVICLGMVIVLKMIYSRRQ